MKPTDRTSTARLLVSLFMAGAVSLAWAADPKASQYYEDALQRYEKKDYAGAVVQLRNVLKLDKSALPAQVLLGKVLLANGEAPAAEVALSESLRLGANRAEVIGPLAQSLILQARLGEVVDPNGKFALAGLPPSAQQELLLTRASAFSDLNQPREALKAIQDARALDPKDVRSWLAEVPIRIRSREFKEAADTATRAIALDPRSAQAHYLAGSVAHARGNVKGATEAYDKAVAVDPKHTEALLARAGLLMDQGKLEDVSRELAVIRQAAPQEPRAAYLAALVAERKGNAKASREALSEVVAILGPIPIKFLRYRPQVLMLGGLANYGLGSNEKARPYLEGLVAVQPGSPASKLLAQIYMADKNVDRTIETLEAYLKASPADIQATVLLASAQMAKGRHARATQLLQEALKRDDSPRMHTMLGLAMAGGGRSVDAIQELEKAWRKDPKQVAAAAALIELYLRNKQAAKAVLVAEALIKQEPANPGYLTLLGNARTAAGNLSGARAALEQALKLAPDFGLVRLGLARLDIREKKDADAIKHLNALLAKDEKNVDALTEAGWLMERRGQMAEAVKLLTKAADHSGALNANAALAVVDLHLRAGNVIAAVTAMKAIETRAPDSFQVLMTGARVRLANKDAPSAQVLLSRAGRLAEADPRLLTQVALLQASANDAKGAAYSLSKALQIEPDFLPAKAMQVDISIRNGDLAGAEKAAREVALKLPKAALSFALSGDVAAARGNGPAALDAYRKAHQAEPSSESLLRVFAATGAKDAPAAAALAESWLTSHPKDSAVRHRLAATYGGLGQLEKARSHLDKLAADSPNNPVVLNDLANVMLMQKDGQALSVAERALALRPDAPFIMGTVGWAAFKAGQSDRALQLLRDARLRDPKNADTRYFLGTVLASKGRNAEARDELTAAVSSGSSYTKEARVSLDTLK